MERTARTIITLEAEVGGYDSKTLSIKNGEQELEVEFLPDYVHVIETVNGKIHFDVFPRKNWDKRLWRLIWARFRARCKE